MKTTLPYYDPDRKGGWGMFGYAGYCCDIAIKRDDPKQAEECWQRGYMDHSTRMLVGTVGDECALRAPKVAALLLKLGPCKAPPMADAEFLEPAEAV